MAYATEGDNFMRAFWMIDALRRPAPHFDPLILSTGDKSDAVETAFMLTETVRDHLGAPPPYAGHADDLHLESRNQDGQVTKAEFMESAQTHFAETDTNGDGFVTEDERTAHRAARFEDKKNEIFAKLDANGDGSVSRDEMDAIGERMTARKDKWKAKKLERYDTNLDGELNDSERTIMDAERDAKKAERRADGGERRGANGSAFEPHS